MKMQVPQTIVGGNAMRAELVESLAQGGEGERAAAHSARSIRAGSSLRALFTRVLTGYASICSAG